MLISIFFFSLWEHDKACTKNNTLLNDGWRVVALISIILCDWVMLLYGFAFEASNPASGKPVAMAVRLKETFDRWTGGMFSGLYLGFIWFFLAFTPLFVVVGTRFSTWGFLSVLFTFLFWTLYGVVAVAGDRHRLGLPYGISHQMRNAAYVPAVQSNSHTVLCCFPALLTAYPFPLITSTGTMYLTLRQKMPLESSLRPLH